MDHFGNVLLDYKLAAKDKICIFEYVQKLKEKEKK